MTKLIDDSAHDAKLEAIRAGTAAHVCSGDPADRAAVLTNSLATFAPTFTAISNGTGGTRRQTTLQTETGVSVTSDGTAAHLCIIDGSVLLEKTEITPNVGLTNGQSITVNSHDVESLQST